MSDSGPDSDQKARGEDDENREPAMPTPFWRKPAFAVLAALIAMIGAIWRCA